MESLFDVIAEHGMTVSVSRQGVELTRAAIGAVAVVKFAPFEHPLDVRHGNPPAQRSSAIAQYKLSASTNVSERLCVVVAHDKAGVQFLESTTAAGSGGWSMKALVD